MARRVKALAAKLDNLSSIPGTRMMEGENWLPCCLLTNIHVLWHRHEINKF